MEVMMNMIDGVHLRIKKFTKILGAILMIRRSVRNFSSVAISFLFTRRNTIGLKLKNGKEVVVPRMFVRDLATLAYGFQLAPLDLREGKVILNDGTKVDPASKNLFLEPLISKGWMIDGERIRKNGISFYKTSSLIEIFEVFERNVYDANVKGRTVVDIGAGIGDSALYFAACGAKNVIAYEILPSRFNEAKEILGVNPTLAKCIDFINAGVGLMSEEATVQDFFATGKPKVQVPVVTLSSILSKIDDPYLLKIDCEGCEYQLITKDFDHIRLFEKIIFEYHPILVFKQVKRLLNILQHEYQCETIIGDELIGIMKCTKKTI